QRLRQEPPTCRSWRVALSISRFHRSLAGGELVGAGVVGRAPGASTPGGKGFVCAATKAPAPAQMPNTPSQSVRFTQRGTTRSLTAAMTDVVAQDELADVAVVHQEDTSAGALGEPLHEPREPLRVFEHEDVERDPASRQTDRLRERQPDRLGLGWPGEERLLA